MKIRSMRKFIISTIVNGGFNNQDTYKARP
jgi:hypothetical protein